EARAAGSGKAEHADRDRPQSARRVDANPDVAAITRPEEGRDVTPKYQHAPQDHHLAGDVIGSRLANALNDLLDIVQRPGGLLRIDPGPHPTRALAASWGRFFVRLPPSPLRPRPRPPRPPWRR